MGDSKEAIEDYSQIISLNPNEALAYFYRGLAWNALGQVQEADSNYNQALEINPNLRQAFEILKFGKSIWNALQKKGEERKTELTKHELVHKDDYNYWLEKAAQAFDNMGSKANQQDKILDCFRQELGSCKYHKIMDKYRNQLGS